MRHSAGPGPAAKVLAPKVFQIELLGGLVLGPQKMTDGVATNQVADLFGGVFHMVRGPFDGLSH